MRLRVRQRLQLSQGRVIFVDSPLCEFLLSNFLCSILLLPQICSLSLLQVQPTHLLLSSHVLPTPQDFANEK